MEILPAFCVEYIRTVDICEFQEALFCSSCTSVEAIHLSLFRLHCLQSISLRRLSDDELAEDSEKYPTSGDCVLGSQRLRAVVQTAGERTLSPGHAAYRTRSLH